MALASAGWELVVSLSDTNDDVVTKTFAMVSTAYDDGAGGAGQLQTDVATIITRLKLITGADVIGYRLSEVYVESAPSTPAEEYQNFNQASITLKGSPGNANINYKIPCPKIGIFQGTTGQAAKRVDTADTDLVSFFGIFTAAGNIATISDGEVLAASGYVVSGKRVGTRAANG